MLIPHYRYIDPAAWPWANFSPDEPNLACPCCGEFWLDHDAMNQLQAARDIFGRPLRVNSGHRCWLHNARVGGAPKSQHKQIAFDVSTRGYDRRQVLEALRQAGFATFGYYVTFIHADTRQGRRWYGSERARQLWNG